jgi:hypothetical protein
MYQLDNGIENVIYSNLVYDIYVSVALGDNNELVATVMSNGVAYNNFIGEFETVYDKEPEVIIPDPPVITPVEEEEFFIWPIILDAVIVGALASFWTVAHIVSKLNRKKKNKGTAD